MRTHVACLILSTALLTHVLADAAEPRRFQDATFIATHNSYAGGKLGSILAQLDAGARFIEFDIHDEGFAEHQDYRLGHDKPGDGVLLGGGNPDTDRLSAWLAQVAEWSDRHRDHAPITIGIDVKGAVQGARAEPLVKCRAGAGALIDNPSYAAGNLAFLNERMTKAFGDKLYAARDHAGGKWPDFDKMRGRVLVVLSGDLCTRRGYRWDRGENPAVAMNAKGQIVEVHDSGGGDGVKAELWYWAGQYRPDGSIDWRRHGKYDTGKRPAVAINDDGWVVEVHEQEAGGGLFYQLGRLGDDLEITWHHAFKGERYDDGRNPTIRFTNPAGLELHEVHASDRPNLPEAQAERRFEWKATIDPATKRIAWRDNRATDAPRFDRSTATAGDRSVSVFTAADGASPDDTLCFKTTAVAKGRIRFDQILFVEHQKGDDESLLNDGAVFSAAAASAAGNVEWALEQRRQGRVVRLWAFNAVPPAIADAPQPPANFPATDKLGEDWYQAYCRRIGVTK